MGGFGGVRGDAAYWFFGDGRRATSISSKVGDSSPFTIMNSQVPAFHDREIAKRPRNLGKAG
jgi:hypothetical protein